MELTGPKDFDFNKYRENFKAHLWVEFLLRYPYKLDAYVNGENEVPSDLKEANELLLAAKEANSVSGMNPSLKGQLESSYSYIRENMCQAWLYGEVRDPFYEAFSEALERKREKILRSFSKYTPKQFQIPPKKMARPIKLMILISLLVGKNDWELTESLRQFYVNEVPNWAKKYSITIPYQFSGIPMNKPEKPDWARLLRHRLSKSLGFGTVAEDGTVSFEVNSDLIFIYLKRSPRLNFLIPPY